MHRLTQLIAQSTPSDHITLDFESRFLRRKKLTTDSGIAVEIDLPHAVRFREGDQISNGDFVLEIHAAKEPVLKVTGDLARLAWHIGNRHTQCQIEPDALYILDEPVLHNMLEGLGASLEKTQAPFDPEQGAYHSHDHS